MPQPFLNVFQAGTVCIEYFRFMSGSEDVERKNIPEPEFVPSVTYFTHDTGIMSASVARDFHYLLLMPEPSAISLSHWPLSSWGSVSRRLSRSFRNSTPGGCDRVE